jgi:hypothetical protein
VVDILHKVGIKSSSPDDTYQALTTRAGAVAAETTAKLIPLGTHPLCGIASPSTIRTWRTAGAGTHGAQPKEIKPMG